MRFVKVVPQFLKGYASTEQRAELKRITDDTMAALHEDPEYVSIKSDPNDQVLIAAEGTDRKGSDLNDQTLIAAEGPIPYGYEFGNPLNE